jgi:hypothetical protein
LLALPYPQQPEEQVWSESENRLLSWDDQPVQQRLLLDQPEHAPIEALNSRPKLTTFSAIAIKHN